MSGRCLLQLEVRQGTGSLLVWWYRFEFFILMFAAQIHSSGATIMTFIWSDTESFGFRIKLKDSSFSGRFSWIWMQRKRRESVYCDGHRWHGWPHQEIPLSPPSWHLWSSPPRGERRSLNPTPPPGFYGLGRVSLKSQPWLESILNMSHTVALTSLLAVFESNERVGWFGRQTKCSAGWSRQNVECGMVEGMVGRLGPVIVGKCEKCRLPRKAMTCEMKKKYRKHCMYSIYIMYT